MKPTYSPKFISTIAALSLCVSSAVAHHPKGTNNGKWIPLENTGLQPDHKHTVNGQTVTINDDGQAVSGMLQVENSGGTLQSLITKGTINGQNQIINIQEDKNVYVPTITNKGMLDGNKNSSNKNSSDKKGVVEVRRGSTIANFINEGTIKANGERAVMFYATTITNFENKGTGTIESSDGNGSNGNGRSIDIYNATITNFTNSGTIKAKKNNAVYLNASTIETFINEEGGIIESESNSSPSNKNGSYSHTNEHQVHAAIRVQADNSKNSSIKNLENKGTIKGNRAGISIARQADGANSNNYSINIETIKNTGTIEAGNAGIYMVSDFMTIQNIINEGTITIKNGNGDSSNSNGDYSAGIVVAAVTQKQPTYGTIENKNTGTITGGDYGVFIEGGSISNLKNSGTIEGKKDGIAFFNAGGKLHTTITNLEIEGQGIIRGQNNGINISKNNNNDQTVVGNLKIAQGATVEGVSGSGLVLGKDKNNGSSSDKYQLTGKIQVDGILKGTQAGITNYGELGTDGQDAIVVGNGGQIIGVVKNESGGTFKGNITNESSHALQIDNQGKVGNETVIKNNGSGNIEIKDWKLE
ncbi:MAG: hypothetical protein MR629_04015, partial [Helicobacter sp.]|nr:hypothetical protein [Helicobacter sp.]